MFLPFCSFLRLVSIASAFATQEQTFVQLFTSTPVSKIPILKQTAGVAAEGGDSYELPSRLQEEEEEEEDPPSVSDASYHEAPDKGEALQREVASLLEALLEEGEEFVRCTVSFTTDDFYLPSVDSSLRRHLKEAYSEGRQGRLLPVTLFRLPSSPTQDGVGLLPPPSVLSRYRLLGLETCTNRAFLARDPGRLLRLLRRLLQEGLLHLRSKTVFVTHLLRPSQILRFLQSPPVDKMVNVLLATPRGRGPPPSLLLHTHLFFRRQEKVSVGRLGSWPRGRPEGFRWFPEEKLRDFHGFKLRATTFNHPPVSILEPREGGAPSYDGLEIRLLGALASALNFTTEIRPPKDGEKWGRRLPNGSWTGAVGETVRGETDVSFANYFITADRLRMMDMTRPYYIDHACFITPKPGPLPQYTAVAWPFHAWVWAALLGTLALVPPALRALELPSSSSFFGSLEGALWYSWGVFLCRPQPLVPSSPPLRLALVSAWAASLTLSVAYKTSLIAFLLVPLPARPVDTLRDLLGSGLRWGVRDRGGWGEWFRNSLDPTSQAIAAGFQFVRGIEGGLERVLEGDFAFLNSGTFLRYLVASNFTDGRGRTDLHVARECFVPFRIGLGMPKASVYTARFDDVVARVVEAGMVSRWFQELLDKAAERQRRDARKTQQKTQQKESDHSKSQVLSPYHVQGPFILLLMGWVLALLAFVVEAFVLRR